MCCCTLMEEEEREQDVSDLGKGRTEGESGQLLEKPFPLKPLYNYSKSNPISSCLQHTSCVLSKYFNPNLPVSPPSPRTDASSQLSSVYRWY